MKALILCISMIFLSLNLYALPCAKGKGILYKGDTEEAVIQQCGPPTTKQSVKRVIYSLKEWIYYRPHPYDTGVSQIVFLFKNDRVANILINDRYWIPICKQAYVQVGQVTTIQTSCGNWIYNTISTGLCGQILSVGDTLETVESICGQPASQANLATQTIEETLFTYAGGDPQTIIFENGKVTHFK